MHKGKKILAITMTIITIVLLGILNCCQVMDYAFLNPDSITNYIVLFKHMIATINEIISSQANVIDYLTLFTQFIIYSVIIIIEFLILIRCIVAIFVRNAKCKIFGKVLIISLIQVAVYVVSNYHDYVFSLIGENHATIKELILAFSSNVYVWFYVVFVLNILLLILEIFRRINIKKNPDARCFEAIDLIEFYKR